jgi:hypothetical protein
MLNTTFDITEARMSALTFYKFKYLILCNACSKRLFLELAQVQNENDLLCLWHPSTNSTKTFVGEAQNDIKTCLQPFIVSDGSEESRHANLELS